MAKEVTTYTRASGYLDKIFGILNEKYFDGELEKPVITIQSTPKAYGHFTLRDTWQTQQENEMVRKKEINIGAGTINRPIQEVVATLLHEMTHYYNFVHGIKDVSSGGMYHNKRFKEEAEKRGLVIEKHPTYGWTITIPSKELCDWLEQTGFCDIKIGRIESAYGLGDSTEGGDGGAGGSNGTKVKKKSSTRKYICKSCGISVRATKEVRVLCMDCKKQMVVED